MKFLRLLGSATAVVAFLCISAVLAQQCAPDEDRTDCHPEPDSSEERCLARNCTWCPATGGPQYPWCYFPIQVPLGYRVEGEPTETTNGFKLVLKRIVDGRVGERSGAYRGQKEADTLEFEVDRQADYRLRIKLRDVNDRFEVPLQVDAAQGGNAAPLFDVQYVNEPFSFKVIRVSSGAVLFDSSAGLLSFADQLIEISTTLPSSNVYGIGENEQHSFKHNFDSSHTYPLYARDHTPEGDGNIYGVHPHYTVLENDGSTHAVAIVNSNAQQFRTFNQPGPGLNYRTIGGILDLYFFLGPTPENVVQQYTEAVGRYPLPSYWSLGFQICRYGYDKIETMQEVVDRTFAANIPQDVQYGDIDIMDRQLDFTYSQDRFHGLPEYIKEIKARGVKFVTILDPCISTGEPAGTYPAFDLGQQNDVWVKRADGSNAEGRVWPQATVYFPDYSKPSAREYWIGLIKEFHNLLEFDGLWIDMNEPANFVFGDVNGCSGNTWNNPPWVPSIRDGNLATFTLCPDTVTSAGRSYDTHSLYGWFQSEPTRAGALAARPGKRAVVLSRSTFLGSGRWVAHWLGDNFSQWTNLHYSIIGMLQFNQFGIPFAGSDICGFNGNADAPMCQRWQELGAFYPFSRNHNAIGNIPQDPAVWGQEVVESSRKALEIRYLLLPFLYTLFYDHLTKGNTVVRALWHEFPLDANTHNIDTQFLWGQGFMVSPVLESGATAREVYFPDARWFNHYDGTEVPTRGAAAQMPCPMDTILLHYRGGIVYPTQEPALNTELSRQNPFGVTVALDDKQEARGSLYYDDGDEVDSVESGRYYLASYVYSNGELETIVEHDGYPRMSELRVSTVRLLGAPRNVTRVSINGAKSVDLGSSILQSGEIRLVNLNLDPSKGFKIRFE